MVWSSEDFLEGSDDSLPFDHKNALIYRGTAREIFFQPDYTSDRCKTKKSVIDLGYIVAENGLIEQYNRYEIISSNHASAEHGVHAGFWPTAKHYSKNVILELEVPTSHLKVVLKGEKDERSRFPKTLAAESNKAIRKLMNNKGSKRNITESFRRFCRSDLGKNTLIPNTMFLVPHEVPLGIRDKPSSLQQNWIKSVYDADVGYSLPLEIYLEELYEKEGNKLP